MDKALIYGMDRSVMSLRSMALTSVTGYIVKSSIRSPFPTKTRFIITRRISERIKMLELPEELTSEIKDNTQSVLMEMLTWYTRYGEWIPLILTRHGTVDEISSAQACIRAKGIRDMSWRYEIACDHCFAQCLYLCGKHLPSNVKSLYANGQGFLRTNGYGLWRKTEHPESLSQFWFNVHQGRFDGRISLEELTQEQRVTGFALSLARSNIPAIKYFMQAISKEEIRNIIHQNRDNLVDTDYLLSPTIYLEFIRIDRIGFLKSTLSTGLLLALLKRPYQHLFLKAAESLTKNLDTNKFRSIAGRIAAYAAQGHEEHDYRSLFVGFWNLGKRYREKPPADQLSDRTLLLYVFLMRNEKIAFMVFDTIAEEYKDAFLFNFDRDCLFSEMVYEKEYEALKLLVKVCEDRSPRLFEKFRGIFNRQSLSYGTRDIWMRNRPAVLNETLWNCRLLKFLLMMSKHWPGGDSLSTKLAMKKACIRKHMYECILTMTPGLFITLSK